MPWSSPWVEGARKRSSSLQLVRAVESTDCSPDPHRYGLQGCRPDLVSGTSPLRKSVVSKHEAFSLCMEKAHNPPFPGPIWALTSECLTVSTLPATPASGLACPEQLASGFGYGAKPPQHGNPSRQHYHLFFVFPHSTRNLLDPSTVHRNQERLQNANSISLSLYLSTPRCHFNWFPHTGGRPHIMIISPKSPKWAWKEVTRAYLSHQLLLKYMSLCGASGYLNRLSVQFWLRA